MERGPRAQQVAQHSLEYPGIQHCVAQYHHGSSSRVPTRCCSSKLAPNLNFTRGAADGAHTFTVLTTFKLLPNRSGAWGTERASCLSPVSIIITFSLSYVAVNTAHPELLPRPSVDGAAIFACWLPAGVLLSGGSWCVGGRCVWAGCTPYLLWVCAALGAAPLLPVPRGASFSTNSPWRPSVSAPWREVKCVPVCWLPLLFVPTSHKLASPAAACSIWPLLAGACFFRLATITCLLFSRAE
jgi:hypothetical protein